MKHLTSQLYYAMLLNAYQLLEMNCDTINNMNVFPVPDGDTGSNMTRTVQGIFQVPFSAEMSLGDCAAKVAEAMLRSARGNSGVILSVFFRGSAAPSRRNPRPIRRSWQRPSPPVWRALTAQ